MWASFYSLILIATLPTLSPKASASIPCGKPPGSYLGTMSSMRKTPYYFAISLGKYMPLCVRLLLGNTQSSFTLYIYLRRFLPSGLLNHRFSGWFQRVTWEIQSYAWRCSKNYSIFSYSFFFVHSFITERAVYYSCYKYSVFLVSYTSISF